jgi:hypothetical protein
MNSAILALKDKIKHELEHLNIHHSTLETEIEVCADENCGDDKHLH